MDIETLLSVIKMIDIRIEQLGREFEAKGITFPMPRVKELQDLRDHLQSFIEAELSKTEE